jgi:hypothetical protein
MGRSQAPAFLAAAAACIKTGSERTMPVSKAGAPKSAKRAAAGNGPAVALTALHPKWGTPRAGAARFRVPSDDVATSGPQPSTWQRAPTHMHKHKKVGTNVLPLTSCNTPSPTEPCQRQERIHLNAPQRRHECEKHKNYAWIRSRKMLHGKGILKRCCTYLDGCSCRASTCPRLNEWKTIWECAIALAL